MVFRIYFKGNEKYMTLVPNRAEYLRLRGIARQKDLVMEIRITDDKEKRQLLKKKLLQFNYSALPTEEGKLKGSESCSDSVGMDIDYPKDKPEPTAQELSAWINQVKDMVLAKKDELGLLMLERSVCKGLHVVFKRQRHLTQKGNLEWASHVLGVEFDKQAVDTNRVFYGTTDSSEDLLYLSDELFTQPQAETPAESTTTDAGSERASAQVSGENQKAVPEEVSKISGESQKAVSEEVSKGSQFGEVSRALADSQASKSSATASVPQSSESSHLSEESQSSDVSRASETSQPAEVSSTSEESQSSEDSEAAAPEKEETYRGFTFSTIIDKYWEMFYNGKTPTEGDRNSLTFELACQMRSILDNDLEKLKKVIPRYDNLPESEWEQVLTNAVNEPIKGIPYRTKSVLKQLRSESPLGVSVGTKSVPPQMPKNLPPFIKLITSQTPEFARAAVAEMIFPSLGVHLHDVYCKYLDNVKHEFTFMGMLITTTSIGKGLIKAPIECVMKDIKERDAISRQRENEWKQRNPTNKSKREPRPEDICIQYIANDLTNAAFNLRLMDANRNGHKYLYLLLDEPEGLCKITSSGKISEMTEIIRKAFDNADHGQERVSADSITGIAPMRFNFNISSTPAKARKLFGNGAIDGTLTRLFLATMMDIEPKTGETNRVYCCGDYDDAFMAKLKPYIDRLNAASGEIVCPELRHLIAKYVGGIYDRAYLLGSEAYKIYSRRACVIGYLKGIVLYILGGYKWSKAIGDYVLWSIQYDLWCKMRFFGDIAEKDLQAEEEAMNKGFVDILAQLPDEFTREDYLKKRHEFGLKGDGQSTWRSWKHRRYIEEDEVTGCYVKTDRYREVRKCC